MSTLISHLLSLFLSLYTRACVIVCYRIVATFILDFYDSMETKLSESSDRISPLTANLLASLLAVVLLLGTRQQQQHHAHWRRQR